MTRKIRCTIDGTDRSTQAVIHAAGMAVRGAVRRMRTSLRFPNPA